MSDLKLQQRLLAAGYDVGKIDGVWGPKTAAAVDLVLALASEAKLAVSYVQQQLKASGFNPGIVDGRWGSRTRSALDAALAIAMAHRSSAAGVTAPSYFKPGTLTDADYDEAAQLLGVGRAKVLAVKEVESGGAWFTDLRQTILDLDGPGGFIDGVALPKILFEAHVFSAETGHVFDASHPDISSRTWNAALYIGGQSEYARLHAAMLLDEAAALKSASWGMFQILGRNHLVSGYADVHAFVAAMKRGEREQLLAFVAFVKGNGLDRALQAGDWAAFARGYNGPAYAKNAYDTKLAKAYRKWNAV